MSRPGAIILCGGRSRRMGRPKAWLPFGPERILQRSVRLVGEAAAPIVVVAAPGQAVPPLPENVLVVEDQIPGRGPLQGIATGMAALPAGVEFVFAMATDTPFFKPAWIGRLQELIVEDDLAIPFADGFHHPLAALYRVSAVGPAIETLLRDDRLRLLTLTETVRTRVVAAEELREIDPLLETLRNLNDPVSYARALDAAGFGDGAQGR
jgi:molybdopterin-guanine dinucleotide biosynthesis protein A